MNAMAQFQANLANWRPAVDAWLETLPVSIRNDPIRAALAYLLAAPPLQALGAEHFADLDTGRIDWPALDARAISAGDVERALLHTARALASGDPGPALALMLLFPHIEAFHWAHAAGYVYDIVSDRLRRHAFTSR